MLKKFLAGIVFGAGFAIAALSVYTAWIYFVLPPLISQGLDSARIVSEDHNSPPQSFASTPDFSELSVDKMIELATAIIIVKFEEGDGENYKSVVEDVLKKEEGVELYYKVGEVYEENSHYKRSDDFVPSRAIVFMQGDPATMRYSTTFDGERIIGLGGISLALLRDKCEKRL